MNAKSFIAAAAMFVATATAFAAESPEPAPEASATASASNLNLPTLGAPSHTSRDEAKAEAVDFVKNYKTTLSVQLDQYKN
ncbi:MAG: hypothetical protein JWP72_95 [Massilia sp.]|jgi:hypothetical protein|nr:hypothetical protein [Massilia sp.]